MLHHGHITQHAECLSIRFVMLPTDILDDPLLSHTGMIILARLVSYAWRLHYYPGHQALADDLHLSLRQTMVQLARLKDLGWIRLDGGGRGATCDVSFPDPQHRLPRVLIPTPQGAGSSTSDLQDPAHQTCRIQHTSQDSARLKARAGFLADREGDPNAEAAWSALQAALIPEEAPS